MLLPLTKWFWKNEFWIPPGFTWEDLEDTDEVSYPHPHHLLLSIPLAFIIIVKRLVFERVIAVPLSRRLGLQEKVQRKPSPNAILEAFYSKHQKGPEVRELSGLAKQSDLQPRKVERWFRSRLRQDRTSLTKKFCEAWWRSMFFIISFTTGLAVLYNKPWLWDFSEFWTEYPEQPLLTSMYVYYIMQLSFYVSLVITLPFDVKRKDQKVEIIHHAATIFLISFSYCFNYIRVGSLVMITHDASTCLLEPAKIFHYLKWRRMCDTLFIVFSMVFLFTRLVIFPMIIFYAYYYASEHCYPFLGYLMNGSLLALQLVHISWSCLIICMVYRFAVNGTVGKDLRSDSEDGEEGKEETAQEKEAKKNRITPWFRHTCILLGMWSGSKNTSKQN